MRVKNKRLFLVNLLGVMGYVVLTLQWMWLLVVALPGILRSHLFTFFVPQSQQQTSASMPSGIEQSDGAVDSSVLLVLAVLIVAAILGLTIYALRRAPKTIGETGRKITQGTAEHIIPVLTHHAKLSPAKRRFLTARIAFDVKLGLLALPVGLVYIVEPSLPGVSHEVARFGEAILAFMTLILICVQVGVAKTLRIELSHLW